MTFQEGTRAPQMQVPKALTMLAMLTHLHQHTHTYMFCCGSQSCLEHATRDRTDSVMHEYKFNKLKNDQSKYEIRSSFRISKHARTLQATNHSVGAPLPEPQLGWAGRLATPHAICHRLGGFSYATNWNVACKAPDTCTGPGAGKLNIRSMSRRVPSNRTRMPTVCPSLKSEIACSSSKVSSTGGVRSQAKHVDIM